MSLGSVEQAEGYALYMRLYQALRAICARLRLRSSTPGLRMASQTPANLDNPGQAVAAEILSLRRPSQTEAWRRLTLRAPLQQQMQISSRLSLLGHPSPPTPAP